MVANPFDISLSHWSLVICKFDTDFVVDKALLETVRKAKVEWPENKHQIIRNVLSVET